MMDPIKIADAIEACDWSGCSIGNKEILKSAVSALRTAALSDQERAVEVNVGLRGAREIASRDLASVSSVKIPSALVDVPVEPVAWQRRTDSFGWQIVNAEDLDHYRAKGAELRPLYTRPPHREGEDSAEVWPEEPTEAMMRVLFTLNSGTARTTEEVTAVYRQLLALAATRSASATSAKWCADE
ncbi:hypothetical protein GR158_12055 [Shinella sp. AETb1-6]|uniref:hypothetical protein n=1 Tax=Shinella sp. AETb1-6 TaxID=2692210 RepID=UPI0013713471|nr:hypothetical protein [Shinella sp. AETb1-6]MXN51855.1 hypothetical protein [Shinella sp. AETb1-6]